MDYSSIKVQCILLLNRFQSCVMLLCVQVHGNFLGCFTEECR